MNFCHITQSHCCTVLDNQTILFNAVTHNYLTLVACLGKMLAIPVTQQMAMYSQGCVPNFMFLSSKAQFYKRAAIAKTFPGARTLQQLNAGHSQYSMCVSLIASLTKLLTNQPLYSALEYKLCEFERLDKAPKSCATNDLNHVRDLVDVQSCSVHSVGN